MKKQKVVLVLLALCIIPIVFAAAPVVDYSTNATNNTYTNINSEDNNNSSITSTQNTNDSQIPAEQNIQSSVEQQTPPSSPSPFVTTNIKNNKASENQFANTDNLSATQRIKRLEQQINYLNNSQSSVDDIQQKLQKLQGDLEVQQHKTEQLEKQLNDFYSDLDQRINKTKTIPSTSNKPNISDVDTPASVNNKSTAKKKINFPVSVKNYRKTIEDNASDNNVTQTTLNNSDNKYNSKALSSTAVTAKTTVQKDNALQEQQAYNSAFDSLQNRQYDAAAKKLKDYLSSYADGLYAGNAHYWLGEIYFQGNSYAKASTEFDTVVNKYPSSPKTPDSMFKLAYIHDKEGKHLQAESEYKELKKKFPKTGAAKLANEQLSVSSK